MSFRSKVFILAATIALASPAVAQTANGTSTPAGPAADKGTGPSDTGMKAGDAPMTKSTMMKPATGTSTGTGETKGTATGGEPGGNASKN